MKKLTVLGLLVLSLVAFGAAVPGATTTAEAYWCPSYSRYCRTDADCLGYCGSGVPAEWEVCESGCCACAG